MGKWEVVGGEGSGRWREGSGGSSRDGMVVLICEESEDQPTTTQTMFDRFNTHTHTHKQ